MHKLSHINVWLWNDINPQKDTLFLRTVMAPQTQADNTTWHKKVFGTQFWLVMVLHQMVQFLHIQHHFTLPEIPDFFYEGSEVPLTY